MNEEQFHNTLRAFIHREPFVPFLVELKDGKKFVVDYPSVVFSGEMAGYLAEDDLISFRCQEVTSMVMAPAEAK